MFLLTVATNILYTKSIGPSVSMKKTVGTSVFVRTTVGASVFIKEISRNRCFFTKSVGPSVSLEILQAQMFYRKKCRNNDFLYKVCSTKCFYENVARTNVSLKCRNQCFYTKPVGPSVSMTNL